MDKISARSQSSASHNADLQTIPTANSSSNQDYKTMNKALDNIEPKKKFGQTHNDPRKLEKVGKYIRAKMALRRNHRNEAVKTQPELKLDK